MAFKVPEEIVHKADACLFGHSCLKENNRDEPPKCLVKYALGENVLMLQENGKHVCSYRIEYGNRNICTCPVRYAIYMSNKI